MASITISDRTQRGINQRDHVRRRTELRDQVGANRERNSLGQQQPRKSENISAMLRGYR